MRSTAKQRSSALAPLRIYARWSRPRVAKGVRFFLAACTVAASVVVLTQDPPAAWVRWLLAALALSLLLFSMVENRKAARRSSAIGVSGGSGETVRTIERPEAPAVTPDYDWLRWQQDKVKQLESHRTDYVSTLSHELRTPLTSIKGFAELITRDELPNNVTQGYAATILSEADKLSRIVDDIVDLARMESSVLQLRRDRIPTTDLLRDVVKRLQPALTAEKLIMRLPSDLPWIRGDRERLEQVLVRMVLEVVASASPDSPILMRAETGPECVAIWLQYRAANERVERLARGLEGMGQYGEDGLATRLGRGRLSLYISKNLVEAHGGKVRLERNGEHEVRIGITLPY